MLIACWSVKGGVGTSVVAAALSVVLARRHPAGSLVADLGGDLPAVLGEPEADGPGLHQWLAGWPEVPDEALVRLERPVVDGLTLLPRGPVDRWDAPAGVALAEHLLADPRPCVVDAGVLSPGGVAAPLVEVASRSLLVTRPCYLALRRCADAPVTPTGVVVVHERDRALDAVDVEQIVGVPVVGVVGTDPGVARAVDAGLLATRLPRRLARALEGVA